MLGNFTFHNPTKLYFGEEALSNLSKEMAHYGKKVMLVYGGGSIKRNGIYDAVKEELRKADKEVVELGGVMPNPTIEKVREGIQLAKKEAVELILAVGGGSTIDYCKAVAAYTDATHGHTLSAVSGAYYRLLISRSKDAENKFCRLAENIWGVSPDGKNEKDVAIEGLARMEQWMRELGLAMNITDCGADETMLEGMADACPINEGGYVVLTRKDVIDILRKSLECQK